MSEFVEVMRVSELSPTGKTCVEVNDHYVVIVELDGEYFCLDDVCTHDGGPLGEGELEDHCLVCPRHGAKFDVRTGNATCMPATEPTKTYEVKVVGESLMIKL